MRKSVYRSGCCLVCRRVLWATGWPHYRHRIRLRDEYEMGRSDPHPDQTYVLKGHHSALFSYNGKLVEVTGTVDAGNKSPGIPVVLHVTHLKKLADFCH